MTTRMVFSPAAFQFLCRMSKLSLFFPQFQQAPLSLTVAERFPSALRTRSVRVKKWS